MGVVFGRVSQSVGSVLGPNQPTRMCTEFQPSLPPAALEEQGENLLLSMEPCPHLTGSWVSSGMLRRRGPRSGREWAAFILGV